MNNLPLLNEVKRVAQEAAKKVMDIYNSSFKISLKRDNSPVTEADWASHHLIIDGLQKLTPTLPILSEESEEVDFNTRRLWTRYWLVDPLDGTKNFIKRSGEFTVNISLIHQQKPLLGVIVTPTTGVTYAAAQGQGAWCDEKSQTRRLSVRKRPSLPWKIVLGHSHKGPASMSFVQQFQSFHKVLLGSSLKFCAVAEGEADIYPCFGSTFAWDTAAGQCLVEEAGGYVTDLALRPLIYNSKDSLLNPHFVAFGDETIRWQNFLPTRGE